MSASRAIRATVSLTLAGLLAVPGCSKKRPEEGEASAADGQGSAGVEGTSGPSDGAKSPVTAAGAPEGVQPPLALGDALDLVPADARTFVVMRDPASLVVMLQAATQGSIEAMRLVEKAIEEAGGDEGDGVDRFERRLADVAELGSKVQPGVVVATFGEHQTAVRIEGLSEVEVRKLLVEVLALAEPGDLASCVSDGEATLLCAKDEATAKRMKPGQQGAKLEQELASGLPGTAVGSANMLARINNGEEWPSMAVAVTTAEAEVRVDLSSTDLGAAAPFVAPRVPTRLANATATSGFIWASADVSGAKRAMGDLPPMVAGALGAFDGEVSLAAASEALLIRVGLADETMVDGLIALGAAQKDMVLQSLPPDAPVGVAIELKKVEVAGTEEEVLRMVVTPRELPPGMNLPPQLAGGVQIAAATVGGELRIVASQVDAPLGKLLDAETGSIASDAAVGAPASLRKALAAGEVFAVAHLDVDALPLGMDNARANAGLVKMPGMPFDPAKAFEGAARVVAPFSGFTVWGTEHEGQVVTHYSVQLIGDPRTPGGKAALGALAAGIDADRKATWAARDEWPGGSTYALRAAVRRGEIGDGTVAAVAVAMTGIVAAVAIPAFTKYMRKAKASEARLEIARMASTAQLAYADGCDVVTTLKAGPTPTLSLDCNTGPGGRCVPEAKESAGYYDPAAWSADPVWKALGVSMGTGHCYHYSATIEPDRAGTCTLTLVAQGDLDADGERFSTFSQTYRVGKDGLEPDGEMAIVDELE